MKEYLPGVRINNGFKLNTNENIYNCSTNLYFLINIIKNHFDRIKYYPDSENFFLKKIISKKFNIKNKNLFICNGSDEGLFFIFLLLKKKILKIYNFTYPFYKVYCDFNKILYKKIKIKKKLLFSNIIFPNPNSPTGNIFLFKKNNKLINNKFIIIDEAYSDFYQNNYIKFINKKNNLIVIKTFSKYYSIANLRVGFIISNEFIINKLNKIKHCFNSYTVNSISSYLSIECIKDFNYYYFISQKINFLKIIFKNTILKNFIILKSFCNFLLIKINIDFFFFFKKKKIFFRIFYLKNEIFIRLTIPNFKILKLIYFFLKKWN
ncbi:histidinol phosphate aminotransferase [Candidatus Carsonella ruddii CS isolate Thao2000]|uniref:histidinol-phosphate transaminase n=1 Tax=Candidatus Carsonella ruddii CS isolate Thao2000 TaxID=1202537 RepID=J7GSK0_CARRU|nr:aminotransferase class I/II-fold pyridoxal phosphate-dependent enzyme [Candidatus Carsonella ruddii]AFP83732.1 histidinol phosphate aminotransferase [Candidatus Carsonella ruddii CS isolate Thao2000]